MKTSVVMPPPGEFSKSDVYSKRRWLQENFGADGERNFSRVN